MTPKDKLMRPNQGAAANRRPAGQSDGSRNLSDTVAAARAFPAAVAELGSLGNIARMAKVQASSIAGLVALGFFVALFFTSLATPAVWFHVIYGGIAVSSGVAIYRWRVERRRDAKAPATGLWLVVAVVVLFLLLCIILPGL